MWPSLIQKRRLPASLHAAIPNQSNFPRDIEGQESTAVTISGSLPQDACIVISRVSDMDQQVASTLKVGATTKLREHCTFVRANAYGPNQHHCALFNVQTPTVQIKIVIYFLMCKRPQYPTSTSKPPLVVRYNIGRQAKMQTGSRTKRQTWPWFPEKQEPVWQWPVEKKARLWTGSNAAIRSPSFPWTGVHIQASSVIGTPFCTDAGLFRK